MFASTPMMAPLQFEKRTDVLPSIATTLATPIDMGISGTPIALGILAILGITGYAVYYSFFAKPQTSKRKRRRTR